MRERRLLVHVHLEKEKRREKNLGPLKHFRSFPCGLLNMEGKHGKNKLKMTRWRNLGTQAQASFRTFSCENSFEELAIIVGEGL